MLLALVILSSLAAIGFAVVAWRVTREARLRSTIRVAALAEAIDGPPREDAMFSVTEHPPATGNPLLKAAVVGVMAIVIATAAFAFRGGDSERDAAPAPVATTGASAPLELMTMRDTREKSGLTVTGLVRNPRTASPLAHVDVVVLAFDRAGTFVTSKRAPIDFVSLEPGDESPFVVTLPAGAGIVRYRVTFRGESGVIRHIDRRDAAVTIAGTVSK